MQILPENAITCEGVEIGAVRKGKDLSYHVTFDLLEPHRLEAGKFLILAKETTGKLIFIPDLK